IGVLFLAGDDEAATIWNDAAVQDLHERRFSRAVVADDAHALAFSDREIDAVQSPDGAVGLFNAVQTNEVGGRLRHRRQPHGPSLMAGRPGRRSHCLELAPMAALALAVRRLELSAIRLNRRQL